MAMFRALSTSRSRRVGYDRLLDETNYGDPGPNHPVLKRVTSVPARMLFGSSSKNPSPQPVNNLNSKPKQGKKSGMIHPLLSLFDVKKKKKSKVTANPDISRYMEYMKEGGVWNMETNSPVIYYK